MLYLALALVTAAAPSASPAARPWRLSDFGAVSFIDDVQISPGGNAALVDVTRPNLEADEFSNGYRSVNLSDGTSKPMPRDFTGPRWSPDGSTIAWGRPDKNGNVAIVLTKADGTDARTLTHVPRSVVTFVWSHDGKRLAAIETPTHAAGGGSARIHWMTAESDYRDTRPPKRDVYLIDVATGNQRELTHDTWSYGGPETDHDPSWSADDTRLAVVRQPSPLYGDFEHAQYVTIDVTSANVTDAVGHPFFAYPGTVAPAFAPAGNTLAYAHTWDGLLPSREDLYLGGTDVTASMDRDLWSCGAGRAQWQRNDMLFELMDGVDMRLYRVSATGGTPQALTPAGGSVETFSAAPTGRIAYVWTTPTENTELYVLDPQSAPRRVTRFAAMPPGLALAPTRTIQWQAPDGRTIHGQLTTPIGVPVHKAPLVVEPHGGPQCSDDSSASFVAQYFATNGYAYFRPDPRGSDGYGDWSYKAIVGDWGNGPMTDDLSGVDAVLRSGVSKADGLYIEGGSYGGYLTSWTVTHDHRFKAAVAEVPVTDIGLEYALSESPNIVRRFFGTKPLTDRALITKESPMAYASGDTTPTLVMIGLLDTRAPYAQAIEFFKAVAENGTQSQLLADSKAGHGPNDPRGLVLWLQATAAWFVGHGAPAITDAVMPQ